MPEPSSILLDVQSTHSAVRYLGTFHAGDHERWQQFTLEHISRPAIDVERDSALCEETDGLEPIDLGASNSTRTVARLDEHDAHATGPIDAPARARVSEFIGLRLARRAAKT